MTTVQVSGPSKNAVEYLLISHHCHFEWLFHLYCGKIHTLKEQDYDLTKQHPELLKFVLDKT